MTTALLVYYAFMFFIGVMGTARITRLLVDDDWPPVVKLRLWYIRKVPEDWAELAVCAFCVSFWVGLVNGGFAWLSFNHDGKLDWWWIVPNLILGGSYLAAAFNKRDIPA